MQTALCVCIRPSNNGWIAETLDEFEDTVVGPLPTAAEVFRQAKTIGFQPLRSVAMMEPGDLFRIGALWYRLLRRAGKRSHVAVVGESREDTIACTAAITEVSVLSLH